MDRYQDYCRKDVELLRANVTALLPYVPAHAIEFIALSTKMYTDPCFVLDISGLRAYADRLERERSDILRELCDYLGFGSEAELLSCLRSPGKFAVLLERVGAEVPTKWSEKQEKRIPALAKTDQGMLDLANSDDPTVAALARARLECNSSIEASRCGTLIGIAGRGSLPVSLEPYGAHTGRYAAGTSEGVKSDGTNLQNLSKRTGDMTLRQCVRAPEGCRIVACDSSQIEARVLAFIAKESWLLGSFRDREDPYSQMAAFIYNEPYDLIKEWTKGAAARDSNADPELKARYKKYRNVGKTAVLQLGYYAGASRFAEYLRQQGLMLGASKAEHERAAKHVVDIYRRKNECIRRFWKDCEAVIGRIASGASGVFGGPSGRIFTYDGGYLVAGRQEAPVIVLPDGYPLVYSNLRVESGGSGAPGWVYDTVSHGRVRKLPLHSGILCNNLTQALAFAIIRWQAALINRRYPVRINIHDSLGVVVPESEAQACLEYMQEIMRTVPDWAAGLPLDCEGEIGKDFRVV